MNEAMNKNEVKLFGDFGCFLLVNSSEAAPSHRSRQAKIFWFQNFLRSEE